MEKVNRSQTVAKTLAGEEEEEEEEAVERKISLARNRDGRRRG